MERRYLEWKENVKNSTILQFYIMFIFIIIRECQIYLNIDSRLFLLRIFLQSSIALIYLIWEDIDNRNWTISGDRASLPRFVPNKTKSNGNYIHKIFGWASRDTISPLFLRSFDTINENGSGSSLIVAADDTTSRSRKIFKGPKYIAELERVRRNWERQREREIRKKRWQKWRKEERSLVREIEMEKRR